MTPWQLHTPVAFIIFNRPDTTERVFREIAKARPAKLLVVGDGPRGQRAGEAEKVAATRAVIERVDWDCEVLTNFSDTNLGCKKRVSSGIDWVFEQVEEAIILEDDCLPDPSFFPYCEELLDRFRDDLRVGMISGDNLLCGERRGDDSYYFSGYPHIWGWATWRTRWARSYDVNIPLWPMVREGKWLSDICNGSEEVKFWSSLFDAVHTGRVDTWDYQWVFAMFSQAWLSIAPASNLISNIGFGVDATHTKSESKWANMAVESLSFPLVHPQCMIRNKRFDEKEFITHFRTPFSTKVVNKLKHILSK